MTHDLSERLRDPAIDDATADAIAGDLLRELWAGGTLEDLRVLLHRADIRSVRAGAWIASELGERAAPVLDDIVALLSHPQRYVRFFAIDTILVAAGPENGAALARAVTLIDDPDEAVRWKALRLLARASTAQLLAAADHLGEPGLRELVGWLADPQEILHHLDAAQPRTRLFGAAAAARVAAIDRAPLAAAATSADPEVASFAREQRDRLRA